MPPELLRASVRDDGPRQAEHVRYDDLDDLLEAEEHAGARRALPER